jgi:hypothetical protein
MLSKDQYRGTGEKLTRRGFLGVRRAGGRGRYPKAGSVATVISFMPEQGETGFFSSIPTQAARSA